MRGWLRSDKDPLSSKPSEEADTGASSKRSSPGSPPSSDKPAWVTESPPEASDKDKFLPEEPKHTLESLIVPEPVSKRIDSSLQRLAHHHLLYEEWGLKKIDPRGKRVVINLYGPPGTGKSHCAEGIAHALGKKILRVNYAELESKYVGETPKNIVAAFHAAAKHDAVLFFDEADSILGKRLTSVTQSADHGVNVSRSTMLLQLDRFDGIVLFATNLARNYDGAFVRRILTHIEFEIPDKACLERLWQSKLPPSLPLEADITPSWLASESEGLAGGDLVNVLLEAATRAASRRAPLRLVQRPTS